MKHKRLVALSGFVAASSGMAVSPALATTAPPPYSISPASTPFTLSLPAGQNVVFTAVTSIGTIHVTCTGFVLSGKTPSQGLRAVMGHPTITGCSDDSPLMGTETVTTAGHWAFSLTRAGGAALAIPKSGVVMTVNSLSGCTITSNPAAVQKTKGTYSGSTFTVKNASDPIATTSGCSANGAVTWPSSVTISEVLQTSIPLTVVPTPSA